MSETIYNGDFAKYLPRSLADDVNIDAFARILSKDLRETSEDMGGVALYTQIEQLPENIVDVLARDLHVDWYDFSYPLDVKRDLLKNSVRVHKKMGTKSAIEKALSSLCRKSKIEEWFEYGGQPGYFKLSLELKNSMETDKLLEITDKVYMYKRLSAHFEAVCLQRTFRGAAYIGNAMVKLVRIKVKARREQQER